MTGMHRIGPKRRPIGAHAVQALTAVTRASELQFRRFVKKRQAARRMGPNLNRGGIRSEGVQEGHVNIMAGSW